MWAQPRYATSGAQVELFSHNQGCRENDAQALMTAQSTILINQSNIMHCSVHNHEHATSADASKQRKKSFCRTRVITIDDPIN